MAKAYVYVVDRDFGFAPNPFHGYCSLATCKPGIRHKADAWDWVIGMGGSRLGATGRCVFAMLISRKVTFDEYWINPEYIDKRPVRNGSRKMMVGDNIYHFDRSAKRWRQADSHHSNADGSVNTHNLRVDTKSDKVLISHHYFYFGSRAPVVPSHILESIGFRNGRNYRVFDEGICACLLDWLYTSHRESLKIVTADPFDFESSERRYSAADNKVT